MVDWGALARRKYELKGKEAETARMRARSDASMARTAATRAERRYGPGGIERAGLAAEREEVARRYPYGIPEQQAETEASRARSLGVQAGAAQRQAGAAERRAIAYGVQAGAAETQASTAARMQDYWIEADKAERAREQTDEERMSELMEALSGNSPKKKPLKD